MPKGGKVGSSFDSFVEEQDVYEAVVALAIKQVLARDLRGLMKSQVLTRTELAARMKVPKSELDNLLAPDEQDVRLDTLIKAARALGRRLIVTLE